MNALEGPPWPSAGWVHGAVQEGRGSVMVGPEVLLGSDDPRALLEFLRFLRDATSHGLDVSWRARLGSGVPISPLTHLPPPHGGTGLALHPGVSVWRERFRPDSFTWRQGPGFVLLMDTRPGGPVRRHRLNQPDTLRLFARFQTPTSLEELEADSALTELEVMGAVMKLDGLALALPVRQIRPPVVYRRAMHTFQSAFAGPTPEPAPD